MPSVIQCAYSFDSNTFGYIDNTTHEAIFKDISQQITVHMYTSANCNPGTRYESVANCYENQGNFTYAGTNTIPTLSVTPPPPTNGNNDNGGGISISSSGYVSPATAALIVVLSVTGLSIVGFIAYRRHKKQQNKIVHVFEAGQEEIGKSEEMSVRIEDVSEDVPLSAVTKRESTTS